MLEERDKKYSFMCRGCKRVIRLLARPEILLNGSVRPFITHRCHTCEYRGTIAKGKKQIFVYTSDAVMNRDDELVPADEKYV